MPKKRNILLIKTISRYNSLNRYIDEWAFSMRKYGCNTCVLDAWSLAEPTLFNHVISTYKFDAIIDINGVLTSWGIPKNLPLKLSMELIFVIHHLLLKAYMHNPTKEPLFSPVTNIFVIISVIFSLL